MPAQFHKTHQADSNWRPIQIPESQEAFAVQVRRPTFADQLTAHALSTLSYREGGTAALADLAEHRITSAIADWRDVVDEEGKPVPFSCDALRALCDANPGLVYRLISIATDAFLGLTEPERKNSPAPSSVSTGEPSETATPSTPA